MKRILSPILFRVPGGSSHGPPPQQASSPTSLFQDMVPGDQSKADVCVPPPPLRAEFTSLPKVSATLCTQFHCVQALELPCLRPDVGAAVPPMTTDLPLRFHAVSEFFRLLSMNWLFPGRPLGDTDVLFMIL